MFLDALSLSRVHLVGLSRGGRTSIDFAIKYPHRLTTLCLTAANINGLPWSPEFAAIRERVARAAQGTGLDEARRLSSELRVAWDDEPDATTVLDTARSLEGLRRQHSIHAAGVVIAPDPITEHCPVLRLEADGEVVTQFDGKAVDRIGLLKMDFLGLRNLTVITDTLAHIESTTGERVAIEEIPLDDATTFAMVAAGDTDGVFQLESAGYKTLCRQLRPDCFDDIIALGALYRPGALKAGAHLEYARRKHGQSKVDYPHPDLEEILSPTYGLLIYQEQVQQIAQKIAGFTLGEADHIRKAIGKKLADQMASLQAQFIDGCVAKGYEEGLGKELWGLIEGFASYAFNKSHSAAYGLITYQTAWLKRHYPVQYMAALLTSVKNNKDKLPAALHSCRTLGITVLPPDVNASSMDFTPGGEVREIRFGLSAVRNVGEQVVEQIVAARTEKGPFTDFTDFCRKVDASVLNKRTAESLIKAGAFESLGHPRKGLLLVFEPICEQVLATKRAEAEGQFSLFGDASGGNAQLDGEMEVPDLEFDRKEKLVAEREMLGLYVSDHPLLGLERLLTDLTTCPIPEAAAHAARGNLKLAGILVNLQKKFTKRGEPYLAGTLEDLQGGVDVIFFPGVYQQYGDLLAEDAVLCVGGRLDEGEPPKLIASEVSAPDVSEATGAPLVLRVDARQCTPEVVGRLREILADHPGVVPVELEVGNGGGRRTTLRLGEDRTVRRSPGLYAELKTLLGPGAVS
jgi:DNA polymerase III subunit alpha